MNYSFMPIWSYFKIYYLNFKSILLIILSSWGVYSTAQIKKTSNFILGTEFASFVSLPAKDNHDLPLIFDFLFIPNIDFKLIDNLYLGANFEYSFGYIDGEPLPSQKSIGLQTKYFFYPFNHSYKLSKINFLIESGYRRSNYYRDVTQPYGLGLTDNLNSPYFNVSASANIRLFPRFYMNGGYQFLYFPINKSQMRGSKLAFSYHFNEEIEKKPMKQLEVEKQLNNKPADNETKIKFANTLVYSSSFTYIFDSQTKTYDGKYNIYHEKTWANGLSLNLNKSLYFGFDYLYMWTSGSAYDDIKSNNNYYLYGLKFQYDFIPQYRDMLFAEASISYGNYCTYGKLDPYKLDGLVYLGMGVGYDLPITKMLAFRMGFNNYLILNRVEEKYNFTQYILGLAIKFNREENRPRYDWKGVLFRR
ncbi:MAG TPA: hypothetical protein PLU49_01845 [Saprospiraceae bacterium]|nr:hypothetical protein [Saprospiraceae bacterium]